MNMCGQMIMNKNNEKGQVKYPRAILSHNSNPCTVWGKKRFQTYKSKAEEKKTKTHQISHLEKELPKCKSNKRSKNSWCKSGGIGGRARCRGFCCCRCVLDCRNSHEHSHDSQKNSHLQMPPS
ncbi:hypothetical protein OIU79_023769 [Salix purpurea]|uniref:Uncharacterized protein n=1 Tax=Salix purpurea TaxID=77065 RepID=A0A9Q1A9R7_SALPP|nr:hypothetical protein OIU79_023769 [Salix purpurea]